MRRDVPRNLLLAVVCAAALIAAGRYSSYLNTSIASPSQGAKAATAESAKPEPAKDEVAKPAIGPGDPRRGRVEREAARADQGRTC